MPVHEERRLLAYSAEQIFDIVIAVDHYPDFLPWCLSATVFETQNQTFDADLVIGFKMIRETFRSHIAFERPHWIDVRPISGPFKKMHNRWKFEAYDKVSCMTNFYVDFEFRSRLLNAMIGILFQEATRRMVSAFENRARDLYGLDN